MGGHRFAFVLVGSIGAAVVALATPAGAQPADEIEMEPETGSGSTAGSTAPLPDSPPAVEPPAVADPVVAPPPIVKDAKSARKWFLAGTRLVQKGDSLTRAKQSDDAKAQYENAVTAFEKAIEASPDLNYYFDLANVEDKLGRSDRAAVHYRVLLNAQAGVKPDVRKKATAKFAEVSTKVGLVALAVSPEGAAISLDGTEVGRAPLPEPLILMPGTYALAVTADGFQPKQSEINVEEGSEHERTIELSPVTIIIEPTVPVDNDEPVVVPVVSGPSPLPLYIGGGATVALVGVAAVAGILAIGEHSTYTAADSTTPERANAKSSGERLATITDMAIAGAVVAGGFTAYWYAFKYKPGQRPRAAEHPLGAKIGVLPWVKSEAGGLVVAGWF